MAVSLAGAGIEPLVVELVAKGIDALKRKRELVPGLTYSADPTEEDFNGSKTAGVYLRFMAVYAIGLAKAGVTPLASAPKQEPKGTPSIDMVEVPLDVTLTEAFTTR